ncbi:MucB/RseB C-terminal domain-containing protein [Cellvibrio sp. OA-2007]|uniref:MucB/RseB C-terminal domain-containing protein n=1 Tax=Cellvibrio sp. OA-2007 TaxID=529823 RepID=UPI000784A6C3|nr:MucB/RseB C-terminal domain-containing protein [Cellvibrio sp. OA-2007]
MLTPLFIRPVLFVFPLLVSLNLHAQDVVVTSSQAQSNITQSQEVTKLLQKMASIPHTLNYQGSFTYQHKDNPSLQSFRVIHWVQDGIEHERLQHLNGPEREFLRSGKAIGCASLGDQLLQGKIGQLGANLARMDQLYKFEIRGPERVAGREATALLALPLDTYRHSSLLTIDNETGLVLKSWLVDESARPLERYQFIDLDLSPDVDSIRQQPAAKLQRSATAQISECNPSDLKQSEHWRLAWVPPGFAFAGQRQVRDHIDMMMYTDGLTTFSVFVELATGAIPEGVASRGATLAVMDSLVHQGKSYRITVVGEIPVVTAQKIAQNINGL